METGFVGDPFRSRNELLAESPSGAVGQRLPNHPPTPSLAIRTDYHHTGLSVMNSMAAWYFG